MRDESEDRVGFTAGESLPPGKGFDAASSRRWLRERKRRADSTAGLAPAFRLTREEERRLVAAARSGDTRALRRLIDLLSGPVYRFGRGFCGDSPDAEDVAQVALAAVARKLGDFRGEASLTTWAYVVARNACTRQRRRAAREGGRVLSLDAAGPGRTALDVPDPAQDPHRSLERRELGRLIERAISVLPKSQREVLVLRDVEGLPAREVGRILRLNERAVKSRLHRARVALREALAPHVAGHIGPPGAGDAAAGAAKGARGGKRATAGGPRCPDTARLISRYLEGELSPNVCARLETHVAGCPDCGAACETLREALAGCREWRDESLPAEVREAVRRALREMVERARSED